MIGDIPHRGYEAGPGSIRHERRRCQNCGVDCYLYGKDDTPGFRDSFSCACCNCGD